MFGITLPPPKVSLLYKCRDCGHKFKPMFGFLPKKCPHCDGRKVKATIGSVNRASRLIVH